MLVFVELLDGVLPDDDDGDKLLDAVVVGIV
jgi:hypothetical protein